MNTIERQVYVLQNAYVQPIEIVESTTAVPIRITVADYTIPKAAEATAYALGKGRSDPAVLLAKINGNTVSFTPSANFFAVGENSLQIRVTGNRQENLVTFSLPVICCKDMMDDEEQVKDPTLLSQILAKLAELTDRVEDIAEMTEPEMDEIIGGAFRDPDDEETESPEEGGDRPADGRSYNDLEDKPSINGKELMGQMTTEDIGAFGEDDQMSETEMKELLEEVFEQKEEKTCLW